MSVLNVPTVPLSRLSAEAALARLELIVGRRVDGLMHGDHTGFDTGPGGETADARVYLPAQDDVRHIDWNVTARTDEVHVRTHVAERDLSTWALVDATASMDFGTATMEKRDLAAAVTVALAQVASSAGDRFGADVLTADGILRWPHQTGRVHRLKVLRALAEAPRQAPRRDGPAVGLADGIRSLAAHRRRGLRLVVSDLLDPDRDAWGRELRRMSARQRVLVVEVLDPRELEIPDIGVVTFSDPETGATHDVDTSSRKVRRRFASAAAAERQANADAVRRARAAHLVVSTDGDWVRDLTRLLVRERRSRGRTASAGRVMAGGRLMTFLAPERLWLMLGVLVLLVAYLLAQRRRRRHAVRFAALPLLARVAPSPGWRRHLSAMLFMAMAVLLVTGFARPEAEVRVPRERASVVVAVDLSGSMRADDVSPNRFTVAKEAASDFVEQLPDRYRVGLVPFSDTASVAVPPTTDHALVQEAIDDLSIRGATAIGDAIATSVQAATSRAGTGSGDGEDIPARVVLLSDGQNSRGIPVEQGIAAALDADVPVSTIAYGTDDGTLGDTPVPVDRETLADIADQTGGQGYEAATAEELRAVYADLGSSIGYRTEQSEITPWFVAGALVTAFLAALTSLRFAGRLP